MRGRLLWLALAPVSYYLIGRTAWFIWWGLTVGAGLYMLGRREGERIGGENMLVVLDALAEEDGSVQRLEAALTVQEATRVAAQRRAAKERRQ